MTSLLTTLLSLAACSMTNDAVSLSPASVHAGQQFLGVSTLAARSNKSGSGAFLLSIAVFAAAGTFAGWTRLREEKQKEDRREEISRLLKDGAAPPSDIQKAEDQLWEDLVAEHCDEQTQHEYQAQKQQRQEDYVRTSAIQLVCILIAVVVIWIVVAMLMD